MTRAVPAWTGLLAAAALAVACSRAPEPSSAPISAASAPLPGTAAATTPGPAGPATTTTPAATTAISRQPGSNPPAPAQPSIPVKSTTRSPGTTSLPVPPPPPPKPPDRWVFSAADRRSIEQQTGAPFADFQVDGFYQRICPKHDVCLHNAFQVDAGLGHPDEDCWVDHNIVPDPLYEGGTITWVVNNPCGPG